MSIKQPALFRDRIVIPEARRMLKAMELHTSGYFPDEVHALRLLTARGENDLELSVVKYLMELFGYPRSQAKEPRFDKTRRALTKRNGKPPRGGIGVEMRSARTASTTSARQATGVSRSPTARSSRVRFGNTAQNREGRSNP